MEYPKVSITIPCRNEEAYIEACLRSIMDSNYPMEQLTVYVCDGMSDDRTREIIQDLTRQYPNIILIDNLKKTTPFAMNLGLKYDHADVKIILGAHAEVDPDFVIENVKILQTNPKIGCSGGVLENVFENETSKTIGKAMSSSFGVGNAHFRTGAKSGFVDTVAFGAYTQEVFDTIGYFDEDLVRNQDDEFNFRLLKNGFLIFLSPTIKSKYYVRSSFKKLYKQYYQYGYWKVYVNQKHKSVTTIRQLIPPIFVLYLFAGLLAPFLGVILGSLYVAGLLMYFVGAFLFAFKAADNAKQAVSIAYTFFLLHFSYGSGYLFGLFDFVMLGKKPRQTASSLSR